LRAGAGLHSREVGPGGHQRRFRLGHVDFELILLEGEKELAPGDGVADVGRDGGDPPRNLGGEADLLVGREDAVSLEAQRDRAAAHGVHPYGDGLRLRGGRGRGCGRRRLSRARVHARRAGSGGVLGAGREEPTGSGSEEKYENPPDPALLHRQVPSDGKSGESVRRSKQRTVYLRLGLTDWSVSTLPLA